MKLPTLVAEWIERDSSPVDWCEENYVVSLYVAEFVNTMSNILFLTIPPLCYRLWSSYALRVTKQVYVALILFFVIGLSSAYFHATLSLLGQILDELSILWVLVHVNYHFIPIHYRLKTLRPYPSVYKGVIATFGALITICAFVKPEINQYALMTLGLPLTILFVTELTRTNERRIKCLGATAVLALFLAVISWILDKVVCDFWQKINLTIFHGVWHVMIFISTYLAETVACYNYAKYDVPESYPMIKFWPRQKWGLPYVICQSRKKL